MKDEEETEETEEDQEEHEREQRDGYDETEEKRSVIEEDWSHILVSGVGGGGYSRHNKIVEYHLMFDDVARRTKISIECVDELTPLDMVALSWGGVTATTSTDTRSGTTPIINPQHDDNGNDKDNDNCYDSTGHRVWLGAEFFIKSLPFLVDKYLKGKAVLELGAGSGLSGIAIALSCKPSAIMLTDSSPTCLELCKKNCRRNGIEEISKNGNDDMECNENPGVLDDRDSDVKVSVQRLCWGESLSEHREYGEGKSSSTRPGEDPTAYVLKFDTVVATDVLYDFDMWVPLLRTARASLRHNGIFILSHIPRAAIPDEYDRSSASTGPITIESLLLEESRRVGFGLVTQIKPSESLKNDTIVCCEDMEDAGAAIFIFRKEVDVE